MCRPSKPIAGETGWSKLVSAELLESQIKTLIQGLQLSVKSPARFAGGDFKKAKLEFGYLATLFRIVDEYEDQVRWRQDAASASSLCAAAADACRKGDAETFRRVKATRETLTDLLNGNSISAVTKKLGWEAVASRRDWMRWIEGADHRIRANVALLARPSESKSAGEHVMEDGSDAAV